MDLDPLETRPQKQNPSDYFVGAPLAATQKLCPRSNPGIGYQPRNPIYAGVCDPEIDYRPRINFRRPRNRFSDHKSIFYPKINSNGGKNFCFPQPNLWRKKTASCCELLLEKIPRCAVSPLSLGSLPRTQCTEALCISSYALRSRFSTQKSVFSPKNNFNGRRNRAIFGSPLPNSWKKKQNSRDCGEFLDCVIHSAFQKKDLQFRANSFWETF